MRYQWCDKLYISDNLPKDSSFLRFSIENKINVKPIYLVNLSDFPDGQLEIVAASSLRVPFFKNQEKPQVVGIAKGYHHAEKLVERIVTDVYEATGAVNCKSYFKPYF